MLWKWILFHRKLSNRQEWLGLANYSTQREEIERILRSQFRGTNKKNSTKLIEKNRFLLQIQPKQMEKSFLALWKLNIHPCEVQSHPSLLLKHGHQLINSFQCLQEVGFREVTAKRLVNFNQIFSKSVHFNQCFNFLPPDINVLQNIFLTANVPDEIVGEIVYDNKMKLETVHQMALRRYMLNHLEYTPKDIEKIWIYFPALKRRSLQSLDKSKRLLEAAYNMPVNKLPKFILNMQPEEIEELLNIENVCGIDVRKIMSMRSKCNMEHINEIKSICSSYQIPDYAIAFAPKLFYMNVDVLKDRLNTIAKLKRANEFFQNVGIGKVILRLECIKMNIQSKKLDFNATFNDTLVDFVLSRFVHPKGNSSLFYLSYVFKKTEDEIIKALQIRPNSKRYFFPVIHQNIEYLLNQGFTYEDIFKDLHIIFYSIDEIKEFFNRLKNPTELKQLNIDPKKLSKSQMLRLCMYLIEKKCDFNGEGIFINSHVVEFKDENSWQIEEIIKET